MKSIFSFLFLFSQLSFAAPIPATSTSQFLRTDLGLFRSAEGFKIHAGNTSWIHTEPPANNQFIQTVYKAPIIQNGVQAALTVRVDELDTDLSLKKYMSRWLKEYPRLGFKVLESKKVKVESNLGFMIDLLNPTSHKQFRQIVFVKKQVAVILTCRDHRQSFRSSVKECNKIIKNFNWL